jgi:uncharacterized protein (DUF885 family)
MLQNRTALHSYVFPAYDLLAEALTGCLGTSTNEYGLSYFENGKDFYSLLTKVSTGTDKSLEELKESLAEAIVEGCNLMALSLAAEPAIYESALSPDYPETEPRRIIEYVTAKSSKDFPYISCGEYNIKNIPNSLEEYVSPAMYLVPPIDNYEAGVIYINGNPKYSADTLFPTIVHEGYPGHLYQTVATLSREIKNLQESEAELMRKKESGSQANQAAMEIIPTTQHILDNYDVLTIAEKNRLWKLVLKKATVYRTPEGELSVHIYPKIPK